MKLAILITILASLLWGFTNHIDKFLINEIDDKKNNVRILLVFSTFVAGLVLAPIWLIISKFSIEISSISLICILCASLAYTIATIFYFKAIEKNDASVVVVMFQMIPVFSYILALILFKENLTIRQMIGSIIILLSSVIISLDFKEKNKNKKFKALILMTLSSIFCAIYFILFDVGIRNSSYNSCAFWYQMGFLIIGIILLCFKSFRKPFFDAVKKNGKRFFIVNTTNELVNMVAGLLANYANVMIPIALVNVLNGFQGAFTFLIGVLGTIFIPKYIKEDLNKEVVIQKILCIILSIVGLIILVY